MKLHLGCSGLAAGLLFIGLAGNLRADDKPAAAPGQPPAAVETQGKQEAAPPATAAPEAGAEKTGESAALDYVRMTEDGKKVKLETSVATFTLPDGRIVDLFGVVHLGDASYYGEVDARLAKYDAVLFELVGDPSGLTRPDKDKDAPPARPNPLRSMQETMGRVFKLEFQLEKIDYTRPNFVHADASAEEFSQMQKERGESMMKLLAKSFALSADPEMREHVKDAENLGIADLVMLFYSEKSMLRIKVIFAKLLAGSEQVLEKKMLGENNAIIHGRNGVALKKLDEVLQDPAKKRVAVFYGAGHMPSMETAIVDRLKAKRTAEIWLPAWTMPASALGKTKLKAEQPDKTEPAPAAKAAE